MTLECPNSDVFLAGELNARVKDLNDFIDDDETNFISDFIFDFTAAGVVPCGGRKTSPRTLTIVQFIFYFGPLRSAIIF